ncbi:MAG: hypothetical protein IJO02_09370 [Clostridia bacterium]|nr:hypothetical protein [Clostridia bacterium]
MKICSLIRRHASMLALLIVILGLFAAPYLIPENPDSEVFRTGTLGTILMLFCYFPVQQALSRADRRTLASGLGFGFLFAAALSIGSELHVYEGILPGMGSMLRRMAVPCMAAPLFGALAARLMLPREDAHMPRRAPSLNLPMWGYMLVFVACWTPLLLAFYPGMMNYDVFIEYGQFLGGWNDRHPMLYLVFTYAFYRLGLIFGQQTLAMLAVSIVRMVTFAAALAYACHFLQRRRVSAWCLALLTALFALLPIYSVMSVSSAKDTPFAAALLVLSLLCWDALEDPDTFFASRRRRIALVLMIILTWHMRKNGVAALVLLPAVILAMRRRRLQMIRLSLAGVAASVLLAVGMDVVLKPMDQPSFQLYSLPAQQLVRAYNYGDLSEEDRAEIKSWYLDDYDLIVRPHLADGAKGYLKEAYLKEHQGDFMALWARIGKKCPRVYAEAFLMLNQGLWYPDDLTHASIYQSQFWTPVGYLQMHFYDMSDYNIHVKSYLPKLAAWVDKICAQNSYQKYPLLSILFCTATPLWIILFSCAMLIARKKTRSISVCAGVLGLTISYLFGPCTLPRYVLPTFCLAPVVLMLAFLPTHSASAQE